MNEYLWTHDGVRLQYQSSYKNTTLNWLFLPGGPGLGSEALAGLTTLLRDKIPGVIWHVDLPNDGSNILKDKSILNWRQALLQAINAFDNVVLVAHSTPGMYIQTMPELEKLLHGLVLIGTAPDASWQHDFAKFCNINVNPTISKAEMDYQENPNNESLRKLLITAAQYCFVTEKSLLAGITLFENLAINHAANVLAEKMFDAKKYQATWIPQQINTLILSGSSDHITPLSLFKNNPTYQRQNILIQEIAGAGHYPWYENPSEVAQAFQILHQKLS